MNLPQLLDRLRTDPGFMANVSRWEVLPAQPARYAPFPEGLDPRLVAALRARGMERLYSHQAEAAAAALAGRSVVVVTPTASGKTLCYNLPVVQRILERPASRALYLFPTKALAQDQFAGLRELVEAAGAPIEPYVYDGDTPDTLRPRIRQAGHVVMTNPDMLHTGILPHHTRWVRLFENLQFVVIDELHTYRGVFGSHLANVLRRLERICRFYGSNPVYICTSATIANPKELAERLTGRPVELVDQSGAPRGEKHFILYNPPVVTRDGLREPVLKAARRVAGTFLQNGIQTIVFARTRLATEVLVTYLKEDLARGKAGLTTRRAERIRGYRGGYLPAQRRAIEQGLRSGEVLGVVSTNALELGIDIGQLEVAVMAGYPGAIASAWQQAGRAGRRQGTSAAILIASSSPLDQYMVTHPDYFFGRAPEHGLVNPDNLFILTSHLKCAAFELPFADGEAFGLDPAGTAEILAYLEEEKILHHAGGKWHWMNENFPAEDISLRSAASENFVIVDTTSPEPRVIGEMDRLAAMTMLHENAIYIHEGQQYHVDRLAWEERKAYVHAVDVDYYTDAHLAVTVRPLDVLKEREELGLTKAFGEVMTAAKATIFKKIKLHTHENVGWGEIHLPEDEMHTTAYWLTLPEAVTARFEPDELQSALVGLAHLLEGLAPAYLLCDARDLRAAPQIKSPYTDRPTLFLYDAYPGGIGLAEKAYDLHALLLGAALDRVQACPCESGCPSCVGPESHGKQATRRLLELALSHPEVPAS
ncbi:DEAD/DEAH box helicase [Caldinitratiruptor microaerophilus]|uniref:ATP-dependent helicase YprA n=1 Tax=Caldinitratiruptor microaerophilus TaxID=671077 RepID=A0AA35G6X6_9FIRM|nr:DEAD/DEAH box helicase [Caldinitratiruptor microaerophilus]BDG59481.1 putative ATP-dependent helicase YprA [Caldinitratiruptor microaerophilus]